MYNFKVTVKTNQSSHIWRKYVVNKI